MIILSSPGPNFALSFFGSAVSLPLILERISLCLETYEEILLPSLLCKVVSSLSSTLHLRSWTVEPLIVLGVPIGKRLEFLLDYSIIGLVIETTWFTVLNMLSGPRGKFLKRFLILLFYSGAYSTTSRLFDC